MTHKLKIMFTAVGAFALAGAGIATGGTFGHGKVKKNTAQAAVVHSRNGTGRPAGPQGSGPNDELDAAATYLGVTSAALRTDLQSGETLAQVASATAGKSTAGLVGALVAHETAELDAAVTAGSLTQAEATARIAGLTARFTAFVAGTFTHRGPGRFGPSADLAAAATYLGVTTSALAADLRSGETLSQVAAATSGKTTAGLIAALVAHETSELDAAVAAGKLTQAEANARLAMLTQSTTAFVNGTAHFGGPPGGYRP